MPEFRQVFDRKLLPFFQGSIVNVVNAWKEETVTNQEISRAAGCGNSCLGAPLS
jgi:hypothetical protein